MAAVTRLGLYGGPRAPYGSFAGKTPGTPAPTPTTTPTGRKRKKRRYSVEVDGQYFVFDTIFEVQAFLADVREEAETSADKLVTTPVTPKPPRVRVKTGTGKPTTSKVIQREVRKTQKFINRAYIEAAKRRSVDAEISTLLHEKIQDEEDTLLALLLS